MTDLLLLNGPPQCGKDTLGDFIEEHIDASISLKFAQPIRDHIVNLLCLDDEREIENLKNTPMEIFNGRTVREEMIYFSENYMKPRFGDGIFGDILVRTIDMWYSDLHTDLIIVTDSGFDGEAITLIKSGLFDKIYLCKLYREDCSFDTDSRNYLTLTEDDGIFQVFDVSNNGAVHEFANKIMETLGYA
ncbi:MAG: hypothetical protein QQN63_00215 [Nitrosopumilus sp.]